MRDKTEVGPFAPLIIPVMTSLCTGGVGVGGPEGWAAGWSPSQGETQPAAEAGEEAGLFPFEESPLSTVGAGIV